MAVSADSLRLAIVEEVIVGTTPTTPTWDLFRTTGEGITFEVTTTQSDEMGGINRGVKDNILTGATVTGEVTFELSKNKAFELLLSATMGSDWGSDPLTHPGTAADFVYDYQTRRTFTLEKRFTLTDAPTYAFNRFLGCLSDTLNISITPNEPITGAFGFIGEEMITSGTEIAGSNYDQAGTAPIMTAPLVTGIELLEPAGISDVDGTPLGTEVTWMVNSCFTGLDLAFTNNARGLQCIGVLGNNEVVLGRFEVTGTGSIYYAGNEPLDALIDQTEYMLRVTTDDGDGDQYIWTFPRVVFSASSALASGTNTDVMVEFTLQMLEYQSGTYAYTTGISRSGAAVAALAAPIVTEQTKEAV